MSKNTNNSGAIPKAAVSKASRHIGSGEYKLKNAVQTIYETPFNPYSLKRPSLRTFKN